MDADEQKAKGWFQGRVAKMQLMVGILIFGIVLGIFLCFWYALHVAVSVG